ncbi:hypothetical protein ACOMHN_025034 [Nucella lapillus]
MTTGKAPGPDAIPAEVYKTCGETIRNQMTSLDATIVHIYKRKGNRQSCDNPRGISLLSIAGKILARVLLNRLLEHLEQGLLPGSQCGFCAGRGTTDMIFAAHQLQEKCMEQHRDLYTTFVDLTKAFDTHHADKWVYPGINIKYRSDEKLFNPWRLQAVTKVKETVLGDFLFADDCALNAGDYQEESASKASSKSISLWSSPPYCETWTVYRRH